MDQKQGLPYQPSEDGFVFSTTEIQSFIRRGRPIGSCRPTTSPPREGEQISFSCPVESIDLQPGFYWFFGETVNPWPESDNLLRFYWNIDHPAGAPALTRCLTSELNRFQVPFQFKCVTDSASLHRLDTA